jgi:hypothetical protein
LEGGTVSYSRIFAFRGESWNLTAAESKRWLYNLHHISDRLVTKRGEMGKQISYWLLLWYDAVKIGKYLPKFRRNLLPDSSGSRQ